MKKIAKIFSDKYGSTSEVLGKTSCFYFLAGEAFPFMS
jgi:hypothetical protein